MSWGSGGWGQAGWGRGVFADSAAETAAAKDLPSAQQTFSILAVERAGAHDAEISAFGVTSFTVTERASVREAMRGIQIGAAYIIERVSIVERFAAAPIYNARVIEAASANGIHGNTGVYSALASEAAGAHDAPTAAGSTFNFGVTERALARDQPAAPIKTTISIIERASARDVGTALTDLWVPVDDSQSGIWVPVNDNPYGPWAPVTP
jgi:hypothetical protein